MSRATLPLLLLVLSFPAMAPGQERAGPDPLVGCYALEMGPWTPALLHPANATYQTPPDTFRLLKQTGETLFERGKTLVRPVIPHGRTPSAYWQRSGSDSVQVIWTNGHAGVRLDLEVSADSLSGTATAPTDFIGPPVPTARAVARRITCPEPVDERERAEYAIYSAVLDSLYRAASARAHLVSDSTRGVLSVGTGQEDLILSSMETLSDLPSELIADYVASNEAPRRLGAEGFTTRTPVMLLRGAELRQVIEATMDDEGYPDPLLAPGHVSFSRVGFSPDGTMAALYVDFRCGGRCGSGQIVVLEKRRDRWQVQRTERMIVH